jgi:hypothetical protein
MMKKHQSGRLFMAGILFSIPSVLAVTLVMASPRAVVMSGQTFFPSNVSAWTDLDSILDEPGIQDLKAQDPKTQEAKEKDHKAQELKEKELKEKRMKEHETQVTVESMPETTADDLRKKIAVMKDMHSKIAKENEAKFSKKMDYCKKECEAAKSEEEKQKWSAELKALEQAKQEMKADSEKTGTVVNQKIAALEAKLKEMEGAEKSGKEKI